MRNLIHFAKVFGVTWAVVMVVYVTMAGDLIVGIRTRGHWRPSQNMLVFLFWAWPTLVAFIFAVLLEGSIWASRFFLRSSHN